MASLIQHKELDDGRSLWHCAFRYGGKRFLHSLGVMKPEEGRRTLADIQDTLKLIENGKANPPTDPDLFWDYLRSGGRVAKKPGLNVVTLEQVTDEFMAGCAIGAKEEESVSVEQTHIRKFKRFFGCRTPLARLDLASVEAYIGMRLKQSGMHGRTTSAATIKRELGTFRLIWKFATARGYVTAENPATHARRPKSDEATPFLTWAEIEKQIKRDPKMTADEKALLWGCLFMDEEQVLGLLKHVQQNGSGVAYAAIAFTAFTGARRSEMMRGTVGDVDFDAGTIRIREKKKSRKLKTTYRSVQLHKQLAIILKAYLKTHMGGQALFTVDGRHLTKTQATKLFRNAVDRSRWRVIEGFHVLRHSFISLCAMRGISQAIIDAWVGHTTPEMHQRYRHLFPAELESGMGRLFS